MGLRFRDSGLSYDDVLLVPKFGVLEHRADADLSTYLTFEVDLDIPIVSSPMQPITEWEMARAMARRGGLGFIHRFMTIDEQVQQFQHARSYYERVGVALGIKEEDYQRYFALYDAGCRIFCIDVAHAHCKQMGTFLDELPKRDSQLIVGNVGTVEGAQFLQDHGADCIKVGIGPGAACTTREVTGFGVPQLSAIAEVSEGVSVPIMADGGIKNSGDI